jgi:hypothetical protein
MEAGIDTHSQHINYFNPGNESSSLADIPDFQAISRRHEAFWQAQNEQPLFIASANANPARPIQRRTDLIKDAEAWLEAKLQDFYQTRWIGDSLPHLRADFGAVLMSSLFSGRRILDPDTAWDEPFIQDDWSNVDWKLDQNNPWWQMMEERVGQVASQAAGQFLACTPSLGGTADVLLNLRGSEKLCLDVVDQPEKIATAIEAIYPTWWTAFNRLYEIAAGRQAALIHWLLLWSDVPYVVTECDFAYLIGRRDFESLFLPNLVQQSQAVGRSIYHLDGPGSMRHLETLLAQPAIQAIQYVPGAGTPSPLRWLNELRKIQQAGKPLQVVCPAEEVLALCQELRPEGLALLVEGVQSVQHLEALYQAFSKQYS